MGFLNEDEEYVVSDSVSTDSDLDITPPRKKTKVKDKYRQFRDAWLENKDYKSWLNKVPDDLYKAKCSTCNVKFTADLTVIQNHMTSEAHLRRIKREIDDSILSIHFDDNDDGKETTTCKHCQESFSANDTDQLADHLTTTHNMTFYSQNEDDDDEDENIETDFVEKIDNNDSTSVHNNRRNISKAWRFFTKVDAVNSIARCKICSSNLCYKTSVSNLNKHVKRKHRDLMTSEEYIEDLFPTDDKDVVGPSLLKYFKCLDTTLAIYQCFICHKRLSSATRSSLEKHLKCRHPALKMKAEKAKVIISTDGQLYEIGEKSDTESDPVGMDTVYLEDYMDEDSSQISPVKSQLKRKSQSQRVLDASTSDEPTVYNRYKEIDTIGLFGQYITSLLRQLPPDVSNRLQADFVRQTMEAKVGYDIQKPVTNTNNRYSIMISDSLGNSKNQIFDNNENKDD